MNRSLSVGVVVFNTPGSSGGNGTAADGALDRLDGAGSHPVLLLVAAAALPVVVVSTIHIATHIHIPTVQALSSAQATRFIHICIKFSNNKRK